MVQILLENVFGRRLSYDVALDDTVSLLKEAILEVEGEPIEKQRLYYDDIDLEDDRTLASYNIVEASVLYIHAKVFVKGLSGKIIPIGVNPDAVTIAEFKELIQDQEGIPTDQQRFIFHMVQLHDLDKTLASYGIEYGSTVHLVLRLRGGGYTPPKAYAVVLFDWDGDMQHPQVKGLPLSRKTILEIWDVVHNDWYKGNPRHTSDSEILKGSRFIPRNYVRIIRIFNPEFHQQLGDADDNCEVTIPPESGPESSSRSGHQEIPRPPATSNSLTTSKKVLGFFDSLAPKTHRKNQMEPEVERGDTSATLSDSELAIIKDAEAAVEAVTGDSIPVLPRFPYGSLDSVQFFEIRFGDRGLSLVQMEVRLTAQINPYRPIVNITFTCSPVHPKRIISATLTLKFPYNEVQDISPETELGPETETLVEKRNALTATAQLGGNFAGANVGGTATYESSVQRTATRRTQVKIHGFRRGLDTAQWSLQEDSGDGGKGGLPHKVDMSLALNYKPELVQCECLIQVVKGNSGRTVPHSGTQTLPFGSKFA